MKTITRQGPGFYLSVPNPADGRSPLITPLTDAVTLDEAREDAIDAGNISFTQAGYETMDTTDATLYQIAPNGGLAWSECFPICGPEAY